MITHTTRRAACLAALLGVFCLVPLPSSAEKPSPARIVCLGDSITKRGYPKILGELLKVDVINAGVAGHNSAQGLRRMSKDVLAHKPDVVVILFGTNDSRVDSDRAHVAVDDYEENLKDMIKACRRKKIQVVVCTLPPINAARYFERHKKEDFEEQGGLEKILKSYRAAAMRVATARKVPLVDLNQLLAKEPTWMHSDGVHPSPDGNRIIARHVAEVVGPMLESTSQPSQR